MRALTACCFAGFLWIALTALAARPAAGQDPSVVDVLTRATRYVDALHAQLSGMVAEERYEQRVREGGAGRRRVLRSDFLLIQPEGENRYYGFRDVFEVDGQTVRNRDERLARLFLEASASAQRQIEGIRMESALYNIGSVERNFNTPTYALLFLRDSHTLRFAFERVTDWSPSLGLDAPDDRAGVWVLAYRETWPRTLIRGRDGRNMPAQGRFWIEADTGRVLGTELSIDERGLKATIGVRYEEHDEMGHPVPVEMRERYDNRESVTRIDGTATYGRFRRFRVEVTETR